MGGMPRRGFPQYTIFGPDTALSMRAAMPNFRRAGNDGVSVERRGKLILELIPRNNTGAGFAWSDKTIFSLSVEEVGLLLSQLPENSVELSHPTYNNSMDGEDSSVEQLSGDVVEKVFTVEPGEGSTLTFKIDYMSGGIGGQTPPGMEGIPVSYIISCVSCIHLFGLFYMDHINITSYAYQISCSFLYIMKHDNLVLNTTSQTTQHII